ncbi:MAG: hypothetical protein IT195_11860 [Microthrixaceae bacterium]|nr:hypothetical protein [Microthrixaceae bacterium]
MSVRVVFASIAAVAALAAGCSDEADRAEPNSDGTTTTEAAPSTVPSSTTSTTAPKTFADAVALAEAELQAAGSDLCRLIGLGGRMSSFPAPSTRDEALQAVSAMSRYLRAVAAGAEADLPEAATSLGKSADEIDAQAKAVDYDPATLNSPTSLAAFSSEELLEAMGDLNRYATGSC